MTDQTPQTPAEPEDQTTPEPQADAAEAEQPQDAPAPDGQTQPESRPQPQPEADAGRETITAEEAAALTEQMLAEGGAAPRSTGRPAAPPEGSSPLELPAFDGAGPKRVPAELDLLADVNLNVKIELGRTHMLVEDVLQLSDGAVVELDKLAGDPVDIYVNERHIARGEVLVLNDTFCVRINEILEAEDRMVG